MSDLNIDEIQKAIDAIDKLPKAEVIEAILITRLLPGIRRSQYEGKNYFLIGKDTWDQEVKPQLEEVEDRNYSSITRGYMGAITGTPVVEDEGLVRKIILKWAEEMSTSLIMRRRPPKG